MMTTFDKEMMAALNTDGEKLKRLTGQDHGPWELCRDCGALIADDGFSVDPDKCCFYCSPGN